MEQVAKDPDKTSVVGGVGAASTSARRRMLELRLLSARMVLLQRQGRVPSHHACLGEEATIVGAVLGARETDWVFPGAREWGAAVVRGLPIDAYVRHALGARGAPGKAHSPADFLGSRALRIAPPSGVAGAHLVQAVGAAWAARSRKEDVAAVALFDSTVSSSGDFHNALNFAGVFKAPCVFVCRHHGEGDLSEKAIAYGLAVAAVDGADAAAVEDVVRAAIARGASGKGGTLVVARTSPVRELDDAALAPASVVRLAGGSLEAEAATIDAVSAEIEQAVRDAEAAGLPDPATMFDDVYAAPPAHLLSQMKELSTCRR